MAGADAGWAAVLFLASPESLGASPGGMGRARDQKPWNLYRLDLKARTLRLLVDGFTQPTGVTAGPDRDVLVSAVRGGQRGLWRIGEDTLKPELIRAGSFGPPSLSATEQVVAVQYSSGIRRESGSTTLVEIRPRAH